MELKHILARQPGPEVAEQLRIYQDSLRSKTKQMKVRLLPKDEMKYLETVHHIHFQTGFFLVTEDGGIHFFPFAIALTPSLRLVRSTAS